MNGNKSVKSYSYKTFYSRPMITLSCFIFQKETTPLLCAVAKGHQDVCLRLIKHGANINSQNHVSIKHGANINSQNHVSIKHGANINTQNHVSIKHGANINSQNHVSIKHGANINSQNHVSIH